jgi:hypothetical protein
MANQNDSITISKAELASMIADAIASSKVNSPDFSAMGASIGAAVAAGMPAPPPRKVTFGEYQRKVHSSMHLDPKFPNGPALTRTYRVNGDAAQRNTLTDQEINLLNAVTHSGRYINRLVEVMCGADEVSIHWNNRSSDQRNECAQNWKSFADMMQQIVDAQVIERQEEEVLKAEKQERRRTFGQSKATREAIERANAYSVVD